MVFEAVYGSVTLRRTVASAENRTYPGLHFLFVFSVSNIPPPKSHSHSDQLGTSARKFTWHVSVLHVHASSSPL